MRGQSPDGLTLAQPMMMRTSPHGNGLWLTATFLAALLSVVLGQGTVKGDWTDLRKDFGWSVFDKMGRPFNPVGNLQYCALRTITITWDRGISDYSERINKAFKDLRKMNPPGGTVKLQAARYNISNQIVMPSFTCFQGSGMAQTRLFVNDRAPTFRLAGTIRSLHTRCVSVMDMTIDGNMDNQLSRAVEELKRPFAGYGRYGTCIFGFPPFRRHCCRRHRAAISMRTRYSTNLKMGRVFHGAHKLRVLA